MLCGGGGGALVGTGAEFAGGGFVGWAVGGVGGGAVVGRGAAGKSAAAVGFVVVLRAEEGGDEAVEVWVG